MILERRLRHVHFELYEAMLRLNALRIRRLFGLATDLNTLTLRERLAKQLIYLARRSIEKDLPEPAETRINLQLWQHELAQLLGASRRCVNSELKAMEIGLGRTTPFRRISLVWRRADDDNRKVAAVADAFNSHQSPQR